MGGSHFYCRHCGSVQALVIEPVLQREKALGVQGRCATCAYVAFTMIKPARIYCEICDDLEPGLLKAMGGGDAQVLVCAVCLDAKATLFDMKRAKPRS